MIKLNFLLTLRERLSELPEGDVEERLNFYSEMIEDRMEEGLSEEEAVAQVGSIDEIVAQIISDIPLRKVAKEKMRKKRNNAKLRVWEIVLLAVGSPIWLALLIVAAAIVISIIAVVFSVIAAFWSVFGAFVGAAAGGVAVGIFLMCISGNLPAGLFLISAGLVCAGLAIFAFFGCLAATKGTVWLTKKTVFGIKFCFVGKEKA